MSCYLITCELSGSGDYEPLYRAIKSYGTWARIVESTWAVVSDKKATEIRDHLLQFLGDDDRLFVAKHEITDRELKILKKGSPNSVYLRFVIFALSVAISFLTALLATEIKSKRVFAVFVIVMGVGFLSGGLLLVLWYRARKSVPDVVKKIKECIPDEASIASKEQEVGTDKPQKVTETRSFPDRENSSIDGSGEESGQE